MHLFLWTQLWDCSADTSSTLYHIEYRTALTATTLHPQENDRPCIGELISQAAKAHANVQRRAPGIVPITQNLLLLVVARPSIPAPYEPMVQGLLNITLEVIVYSSSDKSILLRMTRKWF